MIGAHDMGGRTCNIMIDPEIDEPVFHADWEKTALATTLAMGFCGFWNIDMSRHARERIGRNEYLNSSYYKIWICGLEKLLVENGVVTVEEIKTRRISDKLREPGNRVEAYQVNDILESGGPVNRDITRAPKYKIGNIVRTANIKTDGHSRLPAYCMGKSGIISSVQGFHVFPDSNAHGKGEDPQWVYSVKFNARELFGDAVKAGHEVNLDLWEPYFE